MINPASHPLQAGEALFSEYDPTLNTGPERYNSPTITEETVISGLLTTIDQLMAEREHEYRAARTDALTGLPNRLALNEKLVEIGRKGAIENCAIGLLDLNSFKALNDGEGHNMGDNVLWDTARRLERSLREGDFLARIGGDEFMVIMFDLPPENIEEAERSLTERINEYAHETGFAKKHGLGGATGIVPYACGMSFEECKDLADKRMYAAKGAARRR